LIVQLKEKYPNRNFVLVAHNSGVTRRENELNLVMSDFEIIQINDYSQAITVKSDANSKHTIARFFRLILRLTANFSKISLTPDKNSTLPKIFFWTRSIRGHYSYLAIPDNVINQILMYLCLAHQSPENGFPSIGLHYRLGDLTTLSNKSPMPEARLSSVLSSVAKSFNYNFIEIFSDSPELAKKRLNDIEPFLQIRIVEASIWETISSLSRTTIFVGTHSKISIWVCLLRLVCNEKGSIYVPEEMRKDIFRNVTSPVAKSRIYFY
jgi:hypothetical protein